MAKRPKKPSKSDIVALIISLAYIAYIVITKYDYINGMPPAQ